MPPHTHYVEPYAGGLSVLLAKPCDGSSEVVNDLDGNFIAEVVTGLGMPTSASVQGDYVSVPDLHGRLVILDKSNTIMAVLGQAETGGYLDA